jgi:YHS domain-containing protein
MSSLEEFRAKLIARLKAAAAGPRWQSTDAEAYMAAHRARHRHFEEAATSLLPAVIQPRLAALAEQFPSARLLTNGHRSWCWFASSDRFPITAKIEFTLEHDESLEHLFVRYDACLMPVFVRFQPHDKLTVPLDRIETQQIAAWIEERIFEFLQTYLGHDRGGDDLDEDLLTDPVCGMRLRRSDVRGQAEYRGHAYAFCSTECKEKFEAQPQDFVTVRAM